MKPLNTLRNSRQFRSLLIIWGLTLISCLFIFRDFLFHDALVAFSDAGSDTRQQYLMQYSTIVNHLKDGTFSFWDLNNGFGTSMFVLNLTNLFLFPVYAAGYLFGIGYMPGAMVYLLILEMFLAATVCYFLLSCFSFSERSKMTASYLYGLNGYMLIWGQHYHFGCFVVFLPLLLLLLERAIRREKFSLTAPLVVAAMVMSSVYMSYMSLLMAGCYLIFRMIQKPAEVSSKKRNTKWMQFIMHCCSIVLGIGIGSFIFMPMAYYLLTISSRLDSEGSFLSRMMEYVSPFAGPFYETAFLRFFSTVFQGIRDYQGYSNFYEAPVLFFSVLFVILGLQYVCTIHRQESSRKSKTMQYIAVLFFVFCMFTRLGSCIFNAFAYPFSRHSFIFMPVFAVVTAFTLDQIRIRRRFSMPALILAAAATAAAHLIAYRTVTEDLLRIYILLFFACAAIILFLVYQLYQSKNFRVKSMVSVLLLLICTVNVSMEGYLSYNDRTYLTRSDPEYWGGLHNPNVTEAVQYLKETDPSLHRVEKDYFSGSLCMDGLAQNYRGISTYNSTPNRHLETFIQQVIPNFPIMAAHEYSFRQIGYYTEHGRLFGIKYLLSRQPDLQLDGYVLLKQFGDIYVYQNNQVSSMARFYTHVGDSSVLNDAYGKTDLERMLLEVLLLDINDTSDSGKGTVSASCAAEFTGSTLLSEEKLSEIYALEKLPVNIENIEADGSSGAVLIPIDRSKTEDYERLYLEFDISVPYISDVTVNPEDPMEYHFRIFPQEPEHVQIAVPDFCDTIELNRYGGEFKGNITNIRLLGSKVQTSESSNAVITLPYAGKDSLISGSVQTEENGFLFLPVPYEEGWNASVDGTSVEILRSDSGFMSIPVEAGEHTFTFEYEQPLFQTGVLVSLVSFGIWVMILVSKKVHRRR